MDAKFLEGRVAMVTGGASGMGKAMALEFARAGAHVAIGSLMADKSDTKVDNELSNLPPMEELERTAREIEALGVKALAVNLDVTSTTSVENFFNKTIEAFEKVDILANAAGITAEHAVENHSEALWLKVMDVNANGIFRITKLVIPGMKQRKWGRIINIASTAAHVGAPLSPAYCASKAAVLGITRCVALEGAEYGITCNSISPGWVETTFGREWISDIAQQQLSKEGNAYIEEVKAENPQKRMIQPIEIGTLAANLCREESLGISGEDIKVSAASVW
jgi:NAD(P)-dependent dehydrogenase (short-subunit alcohol dehydrogenase family)